MPSIPIKPRKRLDYNQDPTPGKHHNVFDLDEFITTHQNLRSNMQQANKHTRRKTSRREESPENIHVLRRKAVLGFENIPPRAPVPLNIALQLVSSSTDFRDLENAQNGKKGGLLGLVEDAMNYTRNGHMRENPNTSHLFSSSQSLTPHHHKSPTLRPRTTTQPSTPLHRILSFLPPASSAALSLTCKTLHHIHTLRYPNPIPLTSTSTTSLPSASPSPSPTQTNTVTHISLAQTLLSWVPTGHHFFAIAERNRPPRGKFMTKRRCAELIVSVNRQYMAEFKLGAWSVWDAGNGEGMGKEGRVEYKEYQKALWLLGHEKVMIEGKKGWRWKRVMDLDVGFDVGRGRELGRGEGERGGRGFLEGGALESVVEDVVRMHEG